MARTSASSASLNGFDRAILAILQREAGTPHRVIGEAVNLSAPAVQRRIRRMEASGVIRASVAVLDPDAVGRPITVIVAVELESERIALIDEARAAFVADPDVQQCYYVTGEADFVLIVTAASMADYEALTRRLFFGNPNVKRFRSHVAMDRAKVGLALPLAEG